MRQSEAELVAFSMTAAIARTPHRGLQFESVFILPPRVDEVLVRNVATGICHTDLHAMDGKFTPLPVVLGHEGSGIVEAIGADVQDIAVGDHVIMSYLACGDCHECNSGHASACRLAGRLCFGGARLDGSHALSSSDGTPLNDRFFGQSSFAQYSIASQNNVIKVSNDLPLELLGPLGCGIMTGAGASWNVLEVQPGSSFAVFGAGAVGLSGLIAARITGASTIIAIDMVQSRLEIASDLGATHVVNASRENVVEAIRSILPTGVDRVLDTTGVAAVVKCAVQSLAQRGVAALASHTEDGYMLDFMDLVLGSKTIRGVAEGGRSARYNITRILDHYIKGQFPFDRLIKTYSHSEIETAISDARAGTVIKPVVLWD